uniref:TLDc domain-containing protein n=1 Tax=Strongyloides venezuelensis TaxID=75913 RepID=A0A0K0FJV2_STRVS
MPDKANKLFLMHAHKNFRQLLVEKNSVLFIRMMRSMTLFVHDTNSSNEMRVGTEAGTSMGYLLRVSNPKGHFLSKNSSTGSNEENSPCNIKYYFSTLELFLTFSIEGGIISRSVFIGSSSNYIFWSTLHPFKLFVSKSSIIDDIGILLSKFSNSKELFISPI